MQTRFRCLLNTLLLSGLAALGSQVQAASFNQPKTVFYGLEMSNFSATLIQHGAGEDPLTFTHSTLDTSELFGDPPNIAFNDSPINFITLMLCDEEIEKLKIRDQEYVKKYGNQLRRELYISAAGYDAAITQGLDEPVVNGSTSTWTERIKGALQSSHLEYLLQVKAEHITGLKTAGCFDSEEKSDINACTSRWVGEQSSAPTVKRLETTLAKYGCLTQKTSEQTIACAEGLANKLNHYQKHKRKITLPTSSVVQSLEDYGCFNEATKADFNACSVRWMLEIRAGIKIAPSDVVIEQDNQAQSAMAAQLMRENHLRDSRYFILQATTLAQPYLNTSRGLLKTPGWMGGSLPVDGGAFEGGSLFASYLKERLKLNKGTTVREYMKAPNSDFYGIGRHYNQSLENGDVYIGGSKLLDEEGVYTRILNVNSGSSLTKSQNGNLLLQIVDPATRGDFQSQNSLTDEEMQTSLKFASKILSEVREHGALSLALFISLFEPSFPDGASLVIVGENAEWFANSEGKSITDVLRELSQDESKFEAAFKKFQELSITSLNPNTFEEFDKLNTHERDSKQHFLYSGMGKEYFRDWLGQLPDRLSNVLFISKADYSIAQLKAFRSRYQLAQ